VAGYYIVRQGDCLANITERFGFSSYRTIWNDPKNADLRERRPNPNVLCPGDQIYIPERKSKTTDHPADAKHTFVVRKPVVVLRMVVQDGDGKPIESANYRLVAGVKSFEGTTGNDGKIEHPIAPDLESAALDFSYRKPNGVTVHQSWNLKLGHLDDVATPSGIQARLTNLRFDCGDVDGVIGPKTEAAIRGFQEWAGLDVDGVAGPKTQAKLKLSHGC
jgi:hypothetical protein